MSIVKDMQHFYPEQNTPPERTSGDKPEPTGLPADLIAGEVSSQDAPRPLSVFDMFRIGIGPSSSHTVGPMRAGKAFTEYLEQAGIALQNIERIDVELFGSLGATGRGHSTDRAVLLGLAGYEPDTVPADVVANLPDTVLETGELTLRGGHTIAFTADNIAFLPRKVLPYHVNALTLSAQVRLAQGEDAQDTCATEGGHVLASQTTHPTGAGSVRRVARTYYSVGGGFVVEELSADPNQPRTHALATSAAVERTHNRAPYPFSSAAQLLRICQRENLTIAQVVRANEEAALPAAEVNAYLDLIRDTMSECVDAGCATTGELPGGLRVQRRAAALHSALIGRDGEPARGSAWAGSSDDPLRAMDWVNLYALAVNEENAAGHRVVTAPTNGAAGVIPAVLGYLLRFCPEGRDGGEDVARDFLLAATAIGALIKTNASIAGAEVGCQGEVGSASAMAAAGLAQAFGGTAAQVENAAEIAMEHSLGLTCDPVGGLVQVPCIERNAIAAVKAINAARMAMWGDGRHTVSLDVAIETMWQTGKDMLSKYKETSAGGLAVNVVEC
ncbi:MAG: L-serine ammonia-lyase [Actinomycetaceae bacterium]|nr:L-serine ammonia-lyase [Actinomycetaceae bacterium]